MWHKGCVRFGAGAGGLFVQLGWPLLGMKPTAPDSGVKMPEDGPCCHMAGLSISTKEPTPCCDGCLAAPLHTSPAAAGAALLEACPPFLVSILRLNSCSCRGVIGAPVSLAAPTVLGLALLPTYPYSTTIHKFIFLARVHLL